MAYNVAANLRPVQPGAAYLDARDNVMRNALAERQVAGSEQNAQFNQNRLMQQDQRQAGLDQAEADQQAQAADLEETKQLYAHLENLANAPPDQFAVLAQRVAADPIVQKHGITLEDFSDQREAAMAAKVLGGKLGIGPAPTKQAESFTLSPGQQRFGPDGQPVASVAAAPDKPSAASQNRIRTMTPQEVAAAGLQPGTAAQIDSNGKIDVLSKRDNTGVLSQKDSTTAKMKINTVALARQQLNKIREAFDEGRQGVNAFGPGQGYLPTQAGKKFDARVNQMRSTLTALTRVPGVGAMSDYETKLDQSKFPTRTAYESVTEDTLRNLDDQLSLIENGYRDLLTGGAQEAPQAAQAPQAASAPVRVNTPAEAARLPAGTQFVTPDGQTRVKR